MRLINSELLRYLILLTYNNKYLTIKQVNNEACTSQVVCVVMLLWDLESVNDRDSRRREIPAPGELFLPGPGPGRFLIFAGNLAGNF